VQHFSPIPPRASSHRDRRKRAELPERGGMRLSVVIPTWNGRKLLHLPLDSLRAQTHRDFEVILVDDASTDGTAEFVSSSWPEVRLVRLEANRGFPGAVNAGIRVATGQAVALLNNDAAADPGWLEQMESALLSHPEAGMVACRVRLYHHQDYLDSAGLQTTTSGSGGSRGAFQPDGPNFAQPAWVLGPAGVAGLYRRALLEDVGLLDEEYGAYYEDLDLALRAQFRGWKCLYWPQAICLHVGSSTYGSLPLRGEGTGVELRESRPGPPAPPPVSDRVLFYAARNYPTILFKFLPLRILLADSWAIIGYELNMAWFAWRHRQLAPYLRGRLAFLTSLPHLLARRRRIAQTRLVDEASAVALFQRPRLRFYLEALWRKVRGT
jgi:GT2 family glycosyltransferase